MSPRSPRYTRDSCKELSSHLIHLSSLPTECRKYGEITADLKRRDSDTTHPTQILS